jgi:WD40 repeat protein
LVLLVLFAVVLAGCGTQTEELVLTAPPASTDAPIVQSTVRPTRSQTISPSPTVLPTKAVGVLESLDGKYKIQSSDWNNFEIVSVDGTQLWTYSYENKFDAGEPGANPFHWSNDGKYIYMTCYHGPDDGSTKFFGNDLKDGDCVFRFDVDTGEVVEIVPEIRPGYYAFSISPNDNLLVYANQTETPVQIKLLDLNSNKEKVLFTADDEILEAGNFGWSPDLSKLIFSTMKIINDKERAYSIRILDLESLETQVIIENTHERLRYEAWDEEDTIQYGYEDGYGEKTTWKLDLGSQLLITLATSTPEP